MSRAALRSLIDGGRWRRVHTGVFLAHNGPITPDQRRWLAALATGALLGGRSALEVLGLKGFPPDRIDVVLPATRKTRDAPADVVVHRTRHLTRQDVHRTGRPPCTMPGRSTVDAAAWARSDREALTVIAMAFQQRLVTWSDIEDVLGTRPRVRRARLIRQAAADATGGAHSLAELDVVRLLRRAGLPRPTLQKVRLDADGRRRYLDLYFETWRVHVEIDGAHHDDPRRAWADMERQNALWIPGERVLRFPAWLVRESPDTVIATIRDALTAAGWRPWLRTA